MKGSLESLVGVWSNYEAEGYGSMEDELYVFAENKLGARIYSNALAWDLELFRWRDEGGALAIEPPRSVFVGEHEPEEKEPTAGTVVRYTLTVERTCWDRDALVLRLDPERGIGSKYAAGALSEPMREALVRYLGLGVTADGSLRIGGATT